MKIFGNYTVSELPSGVVLQLLCPLCLPVSLLLLLLINAVECAVLQHTNSSVWLMEAMQATTGESNR